MLGDIVVAEAYVRAAPDAGAPIEALSAYLTTYNADAAPAQNSPSTGPKVDAKNWQRITSLVAATTPAVRFELLISAGTPGACFLIDDARLYITR